MSYYRPARVDELTDWLLRNFEEELSPGLADYIAGALVEAFDVVGPFKSPS